MKVLTGKKEKDKKTQTARLIWHLNVHTRHPVPPCRLVRDFVVFRERGDGWGWWGVLVGQVQRQLVWAALAEGEDRSDAEVPGEQHKCRVALELEKRRKWGLLCCTISTDSTASQPVCGFTRWTNRKADYDNESTQGCTHCCSHFRFYFTSCMAIHLKLPSRSSWKVNRSVWFGDKLVLIFGRLGVIW